MPDEITAAGPGRIRALNRKAVLRYIRKHGPTPRSDLIPALKLSAAAVSSVTSELMSSGLLRTAAPGASASLAARGRPKSPLEFNPSAVYAIGIRLLPLDDQCRIQMAWVDYAGQVNHLPTQNFINYHQVDGMIDAVTTVLASLEDAVPDKSKIRAATIAIPGVASQNEVLIAPSLKAIEGRGFHLAISHQIKYPISLANDVNLAVLSELHSQYRLSQKNFAYLYIGTGVGAGIGLLGSLWSGNGWAGEVGHLRIARNTGSTASFEDLLRTDTTFTEEIRRLGLAADDLEGLARADADGNFHTLAVLNDYAQTLFELVLVLGSVLGLDEVIIDFPSDSLFKRLLPRVKTSIATQPTQIAISTPANGGVASVQGAAIAALDIALEHIEAGTARQSTAS
jgi:predicted NBD/HSP70 family sugar kinase